MAAHRILACKRLQREFNDLQKNPEETFNVKLVDDDITRWKVSILGPPETAFEGHNLTLWLTFPDRYPFIKPSANFTPNSLYHPNIYLSTGVPCISTLGIHWVSSITVRVLVISLMSLLAQADLDNPANDLAGSVWARPEEYQQLVKYHLDNFGERNS